MKIRLTEVALNDEIYIRTQNSEYLFKVSNPRLCRGFLTGGSLGGEQRDAFWRASFSPTL